MKSAKVMFGELGYTMESNEYSIDYWLNSKRSIFVYKHIYFDLVSKEFVADCNCKPMDINMPTFKAIHQQLEELGWLEE